MGPSYVLCHQLPFRLGEASLNVPIELYTRILPFKHLIPYTDKAAGILLWKIIAFVETNDFIEWQKDVFPNCMSYLLM